MDEASLVGIQFMRGTDPIKSKWEYLILLVCKYIISVYKKKILFVILCNVITCHLVELNLYIYNIYEFNLVYIEIYYFFVGTI